LPFRRDHEVTDLSIETHTSPDGEEIFRLYEAVFGASLTEASRRRWRWQYLENPATTPEGPEIWVAREEGRLLGQYASMPVRLWWGGREVRSSWGMDVFVSAEARGKGVGARLFTAWSDHVDVALGLGLTPSSYGLFKKLRYDDVGPVPFFRKVMDPVAVARRRVGALAPVVGGVLGFVLRVRHPERERPDAVRVTVSRVNGFGAEYDALWERARAGFAMCARRDRAYLQWKYVDCPHRRYDLWEARRDGALAGYAVSRHEEYRGLRLGWVVDVFADEGDAAARDALLGVVLDDFRQARVARAQAFAMSDALTASLRRRGFFPGTSPMQFCVRARVDGHDPLRERGRWHVVFGDSDMDR
jgi:GNAT superfamily N-acetyltransferase